MGRFTASASTVAKQIKQGISKYFSSYQQAGSKEMMVNQDVNTPIKQELVPDLQLKNRCWISHSKHSGKFRENLPPAGYNDEIDEHPSSATPAPQAKPQTHRANSEPIMRAESKPWWLITDEELREEYEQCRAKAPQVGPNFLWCDRRSSLDQRSLLASRGLKRPTAVGACMVTCPKTEETVVRFTKDLAVPAHADEGEALAQGDVVDLTTPEMVSLLSGALPEEFSDSTKPTLPSPPPPPPGLKPRPAPCSLRKYQEAIQEQIKDVPVKVDADNLRYEAEYKSIFRPLERNNTWL
ncbi:uncharacterized protein F4812DRAFT_471399 [Daldinia caldariorum]|uniref:uncharacterized protein n=1 Tax=Daldinia caldariorum TaxID=326644 RepID=UPI0020079F9A|nr:uncharacterized protein F4812DRAFT_471399 [Daldinia caldariorum]KAI1467350.1 hypothetical protein F4812DRAFT_471399 [Daldinia caldariorum]